MQTEVDARIAALERQLAEARAGEAAARRDAEAARQELAEARREQTVTAEILRVMSQSPADDQPVLDAITRSARRLCGADQAWLNLLDGAEVVNVAADGAPEGWRPTRSPVVEDHLFTYIMREQLLMVFCGHDHPVFDRFPQDRADAIRAGVHAGVVVPLILGGETIGNLALPRHEARPFSAPEIALVKTFADQAVIAIENARLFRELQGTSRQLAEVSRHKSEFLANMSHELRTPLNGIIGFSDVLLDPEMPVDEAMRQQFLTNINDAGKHLLTLINDILDLSKVEAGKMELHPEDFDLGESLQGVHAVVKALADRKRHRLRLDLPPAPATLHHDPGRFKQVLFNLLSNAVKFTPDGGAITTCARLSGAWIEVAVQDTGIGIAPEDQEKVFAEFQQIDSGYARTQQGTGLGLALVRSFVRLMGGDITLQSVLGAGSTFTVCLPRRQAGDGNAPRVPADTPARAP